MYRIIHEFDSKPGLVPPFVVIEHVYLLIKGIWKRTCRKTKENCKFNVVSLNFFKGKS